MKTLKYYSGYKRTECIDNSLFSNDQIKKLEKIKFSRLNNIRDIEGYYCWGLTSAEVIIRFPNGCNNIFISSYHYINLINGCKAFNQSANINLPEKDTYAKPSKWLILIRNFNKNSIDQNLYLKAQLSQEKFGIKPLKQAGNDEIN